MRRTVRAGKALLGQCGSTTPQSRAGTCTAFAMTAWKTPPGFCPLLAWGNPWVSTACACPWGTEKCRNRHGALGTAREAGMWEQHLTCEPCSARMLPSCPQGPKPWDRGSRSKQGTVPQAQQRASSGGWVCRRSIPASWLHWAPANLPGWRGQRMSQLSPAQGMRAELQVMEQRGNGTLGCSQTPSPAKISCRSFSQCPGLYSWVLWHRDCSRCPVGLGFWSDHVWC